jgi:hypothetical protein
MVANKLMFDASHADAVFARCRPDGMFDFNALIPTMMTIVQPRTHTPDWHWEQWGKDVSAFESTCGIANGKAFIEFTTDWLDRLGEVMCYAFGHTFGIPFQYSYADGDIDHWCVEMWDIVDGRAKRVKLEDGWETPWFVYYELVNPCAMTGKPKRLAFLSGLGAICNHHHPDNMYDPHEIDGPDVGMDEYFEGEDQTAEVEHA